MIAVQTWDMAEPPWKASCWGCGAARRPEDLGEDGTCADHLRDTPAQRCQRLKPK